MLYWGRAIVRESGWQNMWKQSDIGVSWKWDSNGCTLVSYGKRHEFNESYHDSWYETKNAWLVMYGKWQRVGWRWIVIMREHRSQVLQSVPSLASAHKVSTLMREFACKGTSEELNGFRRVTLAKSEEGDYHSGWRDSISWSNASNLLLLSVSIQCDDTVLLNYEWFHDWVEKKEVILSFRPIHSKHKKL